MWSFLLAFVILLPLQLLATEQEPVLLDWQPQAIHRESKEYGEQQIITSRFKALPVSGGKGKTEDRNINDRFQITGAPLQTYTFCSKQVEADAHYPALLAVSETMGVTTAISQMVVNVSDGRPCPEEASAEQNYHWRRMIYSDQPFLITRTSRAPPSKSSEKKTSSAVYPTSHSLFPDWSSCKQEISYGAAGSDENDPFQKRPPFLPMPVKGDFSITLLPVLRLSTDWQHYLPGTHWWHWLLGEPDQDSGITLQLCFEEGFEEGQPPLVIQISQTELAGFAEQLLNTQQLLRWLAPRLNGRKSFIEQLLDLADRFSETNPFGDVETLEEIQRQIVMVLEQPDTEFSLEFELHTLAHTLSGISSNASPESAIIHFPDGKTTGKSDSLPSDQNSGTPSASNQRSQSEQPDHTSQRDKKEGEENQSPKPPPAASQGLATGSAANNSFAITVNGVEFHIKKEQLPPLNRGQEKASLIKAYKPENPAVSLPLTEVEATAGIPEQNRLAKYDNKPLDYLLTYGTAATKNTLQDYYPVSLISERDGHLVAETGHRGYSVDETCQICQELLLARHSLTTCTQDSRHVFHTGCQAQALQAPLLDAYTGKGQGGSVQAQCPVCRKNQTPELSRLLSKEGLVSELHRAAKAGDSAIIKALLEAHVDVEARNVQGNTALHLAAQSGHSDIVLLLTEFGADFEAENRAGHLPIATAAEYPDIIDILKQAQQNPSIFFTVGHGREEALRQWLDEGNNLEVTRSYDGSSLLHLAVQHNHIDIARQLLNKARVYNIDLVNQVDNEKATPLHTASPLGNLEMIKLLLENSANVHRANTFSATPLLLSAMEGHFEVVAVFLKAGAEVDKATSIGGTALMVAAGDGHLELVKLLLENGAEVSQYLQRIIPEDLQDELPEIIEEAVSEGLKKALRSKEYQERLAEVLKKVPEHQQKATEEKFQKIFLETLNKKTGLEHYSEAFTEQYANINQAIETSRGITALTLAAQGGYHEVVSLLLEKGAEVNNSAPFVGTALTAASLHGHLDVAELLLRAGVDVNRADSEDGTTALMAAAEGGHVEIVSLLIQQGAKINLTNSEGISALYTAVESEHYEVARLLLSKGTDALVHPQSSTDLHKAALKGNTKVAKFLLENGAVVNRANVKGDTALLKAAVYGHIELSKLLLESGAEVNHTNLKGISALMLASAKGHSETTWLLLDWGADVNLAEPQGITALMMAASQSHSDAVWRLLQRGANVNQANNSKGTTALMEAAQKGDHYTTWLLLEQGAMVDQADFNGATALLKAVTSGNTETVKILLERGAEVNPPLHGSAAKMLCCAKGLLCLLSCMKGGVLAASDNPPPSTALMIANSKGYTEIAQILQGGVSWQPRYTSAVTQQPVPSPAMITDAPSERTPLLQTQRNE